MSAPKEKNSVWYCLLLLPIAASILVTAGGVLTLLGVVALAAWFAVFKGSQKAFNDGKGTMWWQYVPFISKTGNGSAAKQTIPPQPTVKPPQPVVPQRPVTPPQSATAAGGAHWNRSAPAFNPQRLTATIESLQWSMSDVDALAAEAGEKLQYGLAFRSQAGQMMPHSQRIDSIQMSEIAARIKGSLPQDAVCRAWPLLELSRGTSMDGLLVVPDQQKPLGLYLIVAGDQMKSRFMVLSMFVPVCTGKTEWIRRIYQPSAAELQSERNLAGTILHLAEQMVS